MPYPPRLQLTDVEYHVWTCATDGLMLALDAEDRTRFVRLLGVVVGRYGWRCHSYCVLGTHYHLVIATPLGNIAAGMQWLNGVYALTFNRRHGRRGHLVGARYSAKSIESEEYAREVCRYVPLNAVRAGLCARPEQWPWSSYAATLGRAIVPPFLDPSWILRQFGDDDEAARAGLRAWVSEALPAAAA